LGRTDEAKTHCTKALENANPEKEQQLITYATQFLAELEIN